MNVLDFNRMKQEGRKITVVTAYDHAMARLVEESPIDCVLVGDSVAMVMHGHPSTLHATVDMMVLHTEAVARGLATKFLVVDMPFLSFRRGPEAALDCVGRLMRAGAHSVKLEGVRGHEDTIERLVHSGVPVMGHIGLTPQSIHQLGGFRVQGKDAEGARELLSQARALEDLGCYAIVLECLPPTLAADITAAAGIPTIGIGTGPACDGQVLVLQDLLGMTTGFKPRFVRHFTDGAAWIGEALGAFHRETTEGRFPSSQETYA